MNQWEVAKWFWDKHRERILAAPKNEWAVDPYAWSEWIQLTPIEEALWTDIRQTNSVFYPQWPEAGFFLDFANPRAKVAIECDGAAWHTDKEKDARRDEKLRGLGWSVYRFPGWQCKTDFDEESGTPGEAYQRIDRIARAHKLRRDGRRLDLTMEDGLRDLLTCLLEANGYDANGEVLK